MIGGSGRRKTALLAALTTLVMLPVPVAAAQQSAGGSAEASSARTEPDDAAAEARKSGHDVELTALRSETSQVFVQPSGEHRLEQYAYPVRARKGTGWSPIDTTLRVGADGTVRPVAVAMDLSLSAGGSGPLVALGQGAAQVRMGWQGKLPKPVLSGDTATYRAVLPGVDLLVRATSTGFSEVLAVKDRSAAMNPALRQIRFPVSAGAGLRLATGGDGTTTAKDAHGRVVFTAGGAMMWDSTARGTATAMSGSSGSRQARMATSLAGGALVIKPDQGLLTSPTARFPLYLDPSMTSGEYRWTHVNRAHTDTSYWNYDRDEGAKVGNAWDDPGNNMYRSLFQFSTEQISGAQVIGASFDIVLDHSPTGTSTPTRLWQTKEIDPAVPLRWMDTEQNGFWIRYLNAEASGHARTNAGEPDMTMAFSSDDLKAQAQVIATARTGFMTLGLRAPNEEDESQWKRFHAETARLVVVYNNAPLAPAKVNFDRPLPCGTATAPTMVGTTRPSFAAVATDPDGDNLVSRLLIRRASDDQLVYQSDAGSTNSGAAFAWPQVPSGALTDGMPYYFTARSDDKVDGDGIDAGPESGRCYFSIDSVKPARPVMSSTDFPDGSPAIPVGTPGIITLRPAASDTDVAEFLYGFDSGKVSLRIKAGADGTARLPVTLWPDTPGGARTKRLYVKAVDRAGNVGPVTPARDLSALPGPAQVPHVRGDVNGDGRADVTTIVDQGNGRTAVWNVPSSSSGFFTGSMAWDSGANGGFPLYRTKPVQGDFDGDGRTDLVLFREEAGHRIGLYSLKTDGNRFDAASDPLWNSGTAGWPLSSARVISGDVNADQSTDIVVQLNNGNGTWKALVFLGGHLGSPVEWLSSPSVGGDWSQTTPLLADVDGDGRSDLVSMRNAGGCRTVTEVYRSSGTAFASTPAILLDSGPGGYCWDRSKPAVGDVDGDGKDDLVAMYDTSAATAGMSVKIFRSTGSALVTTDGWSDTGRFDPVKTTLVVGDFTLDRKADVGLVSALDGGGREVFSLVSNGTGFAAPVSGWREAAVGAVTGPKFAIENRTYELVSRSSGRCLEIAGASQAITEVAQQWDCFGGLHQRFRLDQVAGTEQYEAHTVHANGSTRDGKARCLDVQDRNTGENVTVFQYTCNGTSNQQLLLDYVEGSSYDTVVRLKFAHSGKCGGIAGGDTANGAKFVQQSCTSATSQQWYLRPALNTPQLDGRYRIQTVMPKPPGVTEPFVLDVKDCNPALGLRTWDWIPSSGCQKWNIKPLGDDVYQITNANDGQALDVDGCSPNKEAPVIELAVNGDDDCQRWRVEPAADGSYSIQQVKTGYSLDIPGCSDQKVDHLITWSYWNGPCQRWKLDKF
ncbi:VCBS repeat protein [Kribbella voronezhensis]|uniref:VCBS repeat protein n=1 Tax=Kribbella voronezhensis TaxID=2512212 RepID=A0A4R7TH66_9ACTN|nr:RICIN domain-containing protein [Kribbella voronezhensis]TDU91615.1 VCBS repeat protein [Kribbella voronezhensis]